MGKEEGRGRQGERLLSFLLPSYEDYYEEDRLKPLRTYHYQGIDRSPISRYILTPYWNWAVTLFPLWMAPNLITLLGLLFMLASLGVCLWYVPDLVGPGPLWIYFFYAACMWIYSTLDNVDGKQARRTNSSSPLGELFDHGCDALNCSIGGVVQISAMAAGSSLKAFLVVGITFWAFYLPTWEEYHTGVLYLGYINGPTEGVLAVILMMILSGIYGPQIWSHTLGEQFPSQFTPNSFFYHLAIPHVAMIFFFSIFFTIYVPTCIIGVRRECKRRGRSFRKALYQLFPMVLMSTTFCMWMCSPYSSLRQSHFSLFILTFGLGFGKMVTKIIYSHHTKLPFPYQTGLLWPLYLGALLINLPAILPFISITPTMEIAYLWIWFGISLIGYFNWWYHVIHSYCGFLNINCFSIVRQKRPIAFRG